MKRILFLLCFLPLLTFGQYRADRNRTNPNVSDGNGYCFRGHTATATPDTTTPPTPSFPVYDYDGNGYDTVVIGTQTWLASNLRTTHYANGASIAKVTETAAWAALTTGAYCWYNNDSATYFGTTGALYNWYVASAANLCPTGYHVPTDMEFCALVNYYDGFVDCPTIEAFETFGVISTSAGEYISQHPFSIKYGGGRNHTGAFGVIDTDAYLWAQSAYSADGIHYINHLASYLNMERRHINKKWGMSVRCIKD